MKTCIIISLTIIVGLTLAGMESVQSDTGDVEITLGADDGTTALKVKNDSETTKFEVTDTGDMTVSGELEFSNGTSQSGAGVTFDDALSTMRLVRGQVAPDAQILAGEGFSVVLAGPGKFEVTFDDAFSSTPICTCCPLASNNRSYTCTSVPISNSRVDFYTAYYDSASGTIQSPLTFSFICVGP